MSTYNIQNLKKYTFSDSIFIKGDELTKFVPTNKKMIRDCNFNFTNTPKLFNMDGMFDGCENAQFRHTLNLNDMSGITTAKNCFRGCNVALLPRVYIDKSNLRICTSMFEDCFRAILDGVNLSEKMIDVEKMFKNCWTAKFNDITNLRVATTNFSELFYHCINGTFKNLNLSIINSDFRGKYICNHMFDGCSNMDSSVFNFEKMLSECVIDADYMFYNAGRDNSGMFDNKIIRFGKLHSCEHMFDKSHFRFSNTYIQLLGNNKQQEHGYTTSIDIKSLHNMFSGLTHADTAPIIVLSDDTFNIDNIDEELSKPLYGHYSRNSGIIDFDSVYKDTSSTTIDIRGISNNTYFTNNSSNNAQYLSFNSFAENCHNLTTIKGHIPPHASSYNSMFKGCENLYTDISKLFKKQTNGWTSDKDLECATKDGSILENYTMTDISYMFDKSDKLYSKDDSFDLCSLLKTIEANNKGIIDTQKCSNVIGDVSIALSTPINGLEMVQYNKDTVSSKHNIIKFETFTKTPRFDIDSQYFKHFFGNGFRRFGGYFINDNTKYFVVEYTPIFDMKSNVVVNYNLTKSDKYYKPLVPHKFKEYFNTDISKVSEYGGEWNEFRYGELILAQIYNTDNTFYGERYVGTYTRICHRIINNGGVIREQVTRYDMPVTYFDTI